MKVGPASARRVIAFAALCAGAWLPAQVMAQETGGRISAAEAAVLLRRADAAYAAGDRDRAEREYAAVVAIDPAQSRAVFRLAQLRETRDRAGAIALYRRYVALEPGDAWGHMALGTALGAHGDVHAALAAYDAAARLAPRERDVHVGRARVLARARHADAAIAAYERIVAEHPRDVEAWQDLAAQQRAAGDHHAAVASLQRARSVAGSARERQAIERDITRNRLATRASVAPLAGASRDSDGLSTTQAGMTVTSALLGTARVSARAGVRRAGDGTHARATQELSAVALLRPSAQLRLELEGGVRRADRTFINLAPTDPIGPPRGPRAPVGRAPAPGASRYQSYPVGRTRVAWRQPGDAIAFDARVGRQLLDASPALVAQGVLRDEAAATVDMRVRGPVRVRGFGRTATIHTDDERNRRDIIGGALAWAPGTYEVTARAQRTTYGAPTTLAYFAPRFVDGAELTTYLERETTGGATLALDLGAGAQRVASWDAEAGAWSPALRAWAQFVQPLGSSLSAGTEIELYDSRFGMEGASFDPAGSRWRYGSVNGWLRIAF